MGSVNINSQYGMCRSSIVAYILREIWVSRCAATFEGTPLKARAICLRKFRRVQLLNLVHIPRRKSTAVQDTGFERWIEALQRFKYFSRSS